MRDCLALVLFVPAVFSGFASCQASAGTQSQAPDARQISGHVHLGGQPAPSGVPVVLQIVSSRYAAPAHELEVARTATDSKGNFAFKGLEAIGHNGGREFFAVSARSPGYGTAYFVVDLTLVARGEADLVLQKEALQKEDAQREAEPSEAAGSAPNAAPSGIARRPANPEAQQVLARAQELLFRKHDVAASIEEFKKALKIDPWYGPGYVLLGLAYMQSRRWSDAQDAFSEASKVEPGNAQAFLGLGSAMNEQHDYTGARKALEHSLELNPGAAEAHYELARTFGSLGKWQEAEPHARRAIEINPDYAGPHVLMGNAYLERRDLSSALAEFREYLRLDPEGNLAPSVKQIIAEIEKAMAADRKGP
jgi:tetratricopeptide (TPR) repeat protein